MGNKPNNKRDFEAIQITSVFVYFVLNMYTKTVLALAYSWKHCNVKYDESSKPLIRLC